MTLRNFKKCRVLVLGALLIGLVLTSACQTTVNRDLKSSLKARDYSSAIRLLRTKVKDKGDDDYRKNVLELAMVLHAARQYEESNKWFRKAEALLEEEKRTTRIFTSSDMFLGEPYENLAINLISALNFLLQKKYSSAVVEAKRIDNEVLKKEVEEDQVPQQLFAMRYFAGLAWEASGKYADAFIEYSRAYKLNPNFKQLELDMLRTAHFSQRWADYEYWQKKFKKSDFKPSEKSELVVVYQEGWAPKKEDHPEIKKHLKIVPHHSQTESAFVQLTDSKFKPELIYDYLEVADKTIRSRLPGQVQRVAENLPFIGGLVQLGGDLSRSEPEKRIWSTLPERFYIARKPLPPGTYQVKVAGLNNRNRRTGEQLNAKVKIRKNQKTILNWRSFN